MEAPIELGVGWGRKGWRKGGGGERGGGGRGIGAIIIADDWSDRQGFPEGER